MTAQFSNEGWALIGWKVYATASHWLSKTGSATWISWWRSRLLALQWRHNWRDGVSNHQPHDCLLNRLSRRRSKKTSKRVTGLCEGNSPVIGEFPAQRASNAKNVSIWWRHHGNLKCLSASVKAIRIGGTGHYRLSYWCITYWTQCYINGSLESTKHIRQNAIKLA